MRGLTLRHLSHRTAWDVLASRYCIACIQHDRLNTNIHTMSCKEKHEYSSLSLTSVWVMMRTHSGQLLRQIRLQCYICERGYLKDPLILGRRLFNEHCVCFVCANTTVSSPLSAVLTAKSFCNHMLIVARVTHINTQHKQKTILKQNKKKVLY